MNDWKWNQYDSHHDVFTHMGRNSVSSTSSLEYLVIFIGSTLLGLTLFCALRRMMCNHAKTTTHINRNVSNRKIRICRFILYTLISLIVATVIVTLFGTNAANVKYADISLQHNAVKLRALSVMSDMKTLGFAVGGAKTVNSFRDNINNNYLPLATSITHEALFYDYYFDTNMKHIDECQELFCPSYARAISMHPLAHNTEDAFEYYLSVGLNSNIEADQFKRKKLNLVVVLDISASMASSLDRYHYDDTKDIDENWSKSKINIAKESIVGLLAHLQDEDRFGMALFDENGYIAKPLNLVAETNMNDIKQHIMEIKTRGSTNFEAGYKKGTQLFDTLTADMRKDSEYENRIIFLTDAMPNTGNIDVHHLFGLSETNANNIETGRIYSTFIGIGIDFQTDLIERITKIRGSNYYAVHSYKEFMDRMDHEFEYMVTPLVFNLELVLNSTQNMYEIEQVYGSPEADQSTGCVMKVNTLFPSASNANEEVKGGITLLKLKKNKDIDMDAAQATNVLRLYVTYEDRNNEKHSNAASITFYADEDDIFENSGIRKAVLLSRYVELIKDWIMDESNADTHTKQMWEHQSKALRVNSKYKERFAVFHEHFVKEMKEVKDESLQKEIDILSKLINANSVQTEQ